METEAAKCLERELTLIFQKGPSSNFDNLAAKPLFYPIKNSIKSVLHLPTFVLKRLSMIEYLHPNDKKLNHWAITRF